MYPRARDPFEQEVHTPKAASRYKKPPKLVHQGFGSFCWSAALESWLHGSPGRPHLKQVDLRARYGDRRGHLRVRTNAPPPWVTDFRMSWAYLHYNTDRHGIVRLDSHFVAARLKKGYIYLAHPSVAAGSLVWHSVVVYGVGYPDGRTLKLAYMDPLKGGYFTRPLQFFRQKNVVFLGWPE